MVKTRDVRWSKALDTQKRLNTIVPVMARDVYVTGQMHVRKISSGPHGPISFALRVRLK